MSFQQFLLENKIIAFKFSNHLFDLGSITKKAANSTALLSSTELPPTVKQQNSFAIAVVDNFYLNIGSLHGENSIHMLNRIIIQTSNNEELISDVNECLKNLCNDVVSVIDNVHHALTTLLDNIQDTTTSTDKSNRIMNYEPYKDNPYDQILLAYSLVKHAFYQNNIFTKLINHQIHMHLQLLAGFVASFLKNTNRPLSKITFLPPINQDPSSLSTSELCIKSAKEALVDFGFQQEAVVVADEKIYSQCVKVNVSFVLINKQGNYTMLFSI
jgi:hypothetical protein